MYNPPQTIIFDNIYNNFILHHRIQLLKKYIWFLPTYYILDAEIDRHIIDSCHVFAKNDQFWQNVLLNIAIRVIFEPIRVIPTRFHRFPAPHHKRELAPTTTHSVSYCYSKKELSALKASNTTITRYFCYKLYIEKKKYYI